MQDYFLAGVGGYVKALEETVVAVMVEKREVFAQLDAIIDNEGLDMVQFGPGDFSMSIGKPGVWDTPEQREARDRMIKTALKYGVRPRVALGVPDDARPLLDMGVRDFILGTDLGTMYTYFKEEGGKLQEVLKGR